MNCYNAELNNNYVLNFCRIWSKSALLFSSKIQKNKVNRIKEPTLVLPSWHTNTVKTTREAGPMYLPEGLGVGPKKNSIHRENTRMRGKVEGTSKEGDRMTEGVAPGTMTQEEGIEEGIDCMEGTRSLRAKSIRVVRMLTQEATGEGMMIEIKGEKGSLIGGGKIADRTREVGGVQVEEGEEDQEIQDRQTNQRTPDSSTMLIQTMAGMTIGEEATQGDIKEAEVPQRDMNRIVAMTPGSRSSKVLKTEAGGEGSREGGGGAGEVRENKIIWVIHDTVTEMTGREEISQIGDVLTEEVPTITLIKSSSNLPRKSKELDGKRKWTAKGGMQVTGG